MLKKRLGLYCTFALPNAPGRHKNFILNNEVEYYLIGQRIQVML